MVKEGKHNQFNLTYYNKESLNKLINSGTPLIERCDTSSNYILLKYDNGLILKLRSCKNNGSKNAKKHLTKNSSKTEIELLQLPSFIENKTI